MGQFLTIDTGGTKTRIVQFEGVASVSEAYSAPVLHEIEIPTPHDGGEYLAQVTDCIKQDFPDFIESPEENVVILAIRGLVQNNILVGDPTLGWYNFDIARELGSRLDGMKIFVQSDAKLGTYGAFPLDFRGRGLFITIGTGIGAGLMIDGEPSRDLQSTEAGHITIEHRGELASWEDFASGTAWFERSGGRQGYDVPADDPIWHWYAENLAAGIAVLLPILYPDTVLIAGKMAEFFDKYADDLRQIVAQNTWQPVAQVKISAVDDPRYVTNRGALVFGLRQMEHRDEA